jgi:hypothetical protein
VLLEMFVMIVVGPRLSGRPYMNTAIPGGLKWHLSSSRTNDFSFQVCLTNPSSEHNIGLGFVVTIVKGSKRKQEKKMEKKKKK